MKELRSEHDIVVVKVKSDYRLVINVGADHGVKEGDKFLIYNVDNEEIIDPITGEGLGYLESVRGTGVAIHVQSKMTTIESNRKEKPRKIVSRPGYSSLVSIMGETVEYHEPELVPFDEPEVGDKVKKI